MKDGSGGGAEMDNAEAEANHVGSEATSSSTQRNSAAVADRGILEHDSASEHASSMMNEKAFSTSTKNNGIFDMEAASLEAEEKKDGSMDMEESTLEEMKSCDDATRSPRDALSLKPAGGAQEKKENGIGRSLEEHEGSNGSGTPKHDSSSSVTEPRKIAAGRTASLKRKQESLKKKQAMLNGSKPTKESDGGEEDLGSRVETEASDTKTSETASGTTKMSSVTIRQESLTKKEAMLNGSKHGETDGAGEHQGSHVEAEAASHHAATGMLLSDGAAAVAGAARMSTKRQTSLEKKQAILNGASEPGSNAAGGATTYDNRIARKKKELMRQALSLSVTEARSTNGELEVNTGAPGGGLATAMLPSAPALSRKENKNNQEKVHKTAPGDDLTAAMLPSTSTMRLNGMVSNDQDISNCGAMEENSCAPGDELAAAMLPFASRSQKGSANGNEASTAPGDELAAAMLPSSLSASKLATNGDKETDDIGKDGANLKDSVASQDEDGKGIIGSLRQMHDDGESEEMRPGAYPVNGRAFGAFPSWGRHDPQSEVASLNGSDVFDASLNGSAVFEASMNGSAVVDAHASQPSLMEDGELDSELMQVTATVLDEDEIEDKVRQEMLRNAVQAEMVEPSNESKIKKRYIMGCVLFALVFIGVVIGLSVRLTNKNKSEQQPALEPVTVAPTSSPSYSPTASPTETPRPTLERLKEKGKVRCGVDVFSGAFEFNKDTGVGEGFEFDLCRAIAAAVFGDTNITRVEPVIVSNAERFKALANKTIDLLSRSTTYTMERDVYQEGAKAGFSFSVPYLYDGLRFAGIPPYGACADNLSSYFGECRLLQICVANATSHEAVVRRLFPRSSIVIVEKILESFINGSCNAMAGENYQLPEKQLRDQGFKGDYEIGTNIFSKEPLALVTRDDDAEWSDFVNWIMQALLAAEERQITQTTAANFTTTAVFGDEFKNMFIDAIAAVGNYGEIYERHLETIVSRQDVDTINIDGSTGLFYAHPFGGQQATGPGPVKGGTLASVSLREQLRCGVTVHVGFADFDSDTNEWSGLDVDYCYALSSALFKRAADSVIFVNLTTTDEYFEALANGTVDVLGGASQNIFTDVMEPLSKQGFSFSQPYFYESPSDVANGSTLRTIRALATRQDDVQWSSFVYWIVASTFYAERNLIRQSTYTNMPTVNLFGPDYVGMFQNAIFAVGNSEEMYERNLESLKPRSGRNRLNKNPYGPQHFPLPGI